MKKFIILSIIFFAVSTQLKAQYLSLNVFGGYTAPDEPNFKNAYAHIDGGFMWGASIEGVKHSQGLELLYQYQSTNIPVYGNGIVGGGGGYSQLNPDNTSGVISYLLLNFNRYFDANPKVQPYAGIGLGTSFIHMDAGNGTGTYFAWDIKGGVKIKVAKSVAIKLGAQLLSSLHQSGTYYYYYYGQPFAYAGYSAVWQFGVTGGLTFDFGGR